MNIATASDRPLSIEDIIMAKAKENEKLRPLNETIDVDNENNDEINKTIKENENSTNINNNNELIVTKVSPDGSILFSYTNSDQNLQKSNNSQINFVNDKINSLEFDTKNLFDLNNQTTNSKMLENYKQTQLKVVDFDDNLKQKFNIEKNKEKIVFDFYRIVGTFKNTSKSNFNELKFIEEKVETSTLISLKMNEANHSNKSNFKNKEPNITKISDFKRDINLHNSILSQGNFGVTVRYFSYQNYAVLLPLIMFFL
ncbi:Hypothetical protein SRAE_2000179000 [Strongyloides ratti]|uniref:Uncharacterized protein n=1 Tax=Strongyloides ratti TaxID=34506 RepID=A0A090LHY5_STRRB|nr:Hypothetical protein SRAE_2000179000 [Strongyloides ratti]CEF67125.1 Hypothetical protein SRAE_2000179000 [Strongyloides ratti]